MRRYELTDSVWLRLEPLVPAHQPGGRWNNHRTTLSGMSRVLNRLVPRREMPDLYGKWQSVYHRHRKRTCDGLIDRIFRTL